MAVQIVNVTSDIGTLSLHEEDNNQNFLDLQVTIFCFSWSSAIILIYCLIVEKQQKIPVYAASAILGFS